MVAWATTRLAILVFGSVLSGTVLIPSVRPLCAALYPGHPGAAHAFLTMAVLGGVMGGPLLAARADRRGQAARLAIAASALDGALLLALVLVPSYPLALMVRALQGAAAVGALAIIMGASPPGEAGQRGAVLGAALVAAVAVGSPLGLALLTIDPRATLVAGGALQLAVAAALVVGGLPARRPRATTARPRLGPTVLRAVLWVGAERVAVGGFVVTFALWGHDTRGLSDRHVGALVACLVVAFALSTYPLGALAGRIAPALIARAGLVAVAAGFALLAAVPVAALPLVLIVAGVGTGAIYGSAMAVVVRDAAVERSATAMGVLHAVGSAGMLIGTAGAGLGSAALRAHDPTLAPGPIVFLVAAAVQLVVAVLATGRPTAAAAPVSAAPGGLPCPKSA